MPLQATSGAASYDAFGGGVAAVPKYIEDYFSTFLYSGNAGTQTVTNGIDLSTKGGMVWIKSRSGAFPHSILDTVRGFNYSGTQTKRLDPSTTDSQADAAGNATQASPLTDGFSVTTSGGGAINFYNASGSTYTSWSWAKAPKFFDVVTYTGNGAATRAISHSLASTPGFVIIKETSTADNWHCWHRSFASFSTYILLNTTGGSTTAGGTTIFKGMSATDFTIGSDSGVNANGSTYVAYLFAHNAGGFGLTGTDNVISCGSFTTDGSGNATVSLGYEPQWVLVKGTGSGFGWSLFDNMRGMPVTGDSRELLANSSSAEGGIGSSYFNPTATGFYMGAFSANQAYIYIAIRRGPMKVPTSGTSVFAPALGTSASTIPTFVTNFPVDLGFYHSRANTADWFLSSRLQGGGTLNTNTTLAEAAPDANYAFDSNTGWGKNFNSDKASSNFRRAPSFFDEVCYTGTGSANTAFTHNLTVTPELMIVKPRSAATAPNWRVWSPINSTDFNLLQLSTNGAASSSLYSSSNVFPAIPTATTFTVGGSGSIQLNESGQTFVAYLFATCAGVSKVGSFTGNGSSQTINCGFTGGARFVMVKATSTTGDWMVADSARGIVSGSDPYLELNNTNAEVTGEDWLDTDSTGFVVNEVSGSNANTNGVTYIFLAIA